MNILVIAAHPDDEVLGMGASIKKFSKKNNVILYSVDNISIFISASSGIMIDLDILWISGAH